MTMTKPRILHRGKRALSQKIYGTDKHWRSIPSLQGELPIFVLAGQYVGYDDAIDAALQAKQESAKPPPPRRHGADAQPEATTGA
jgi:hypothetical protein